MKCLALKPITVDNKRSEKANEQRKTDKLPSFLEKNSLLKSRKNIGIGRINNNSKASILKRKANERNKPAIPQ